MSPGDVIRGFLSACSIDMIRCLMTPHDGPQVPFYVFGMMGYAALKRQLDGSAHGQPRELARWEAVMLGGLAGALASVLTTPADVLKTRIMTASAERSGSAGAMLVHQSFPHFSQVCEGAHAYVRTTPVPMTVHHDCLRRPQHQRGQRTAASCLKALHYRVSYCKLA